MSENVALSIGGRSIGYWDALSITQSIDCHPTISLTAPFEPERKEFRQTFRPFSYLPVEIDVNDARLFTGTLIDVLPQIDAVSSVVDVTAYSRPGVLEDCDLPWHSVPFECNGLTLRQIAEHFCRPFDLGVEVIGSDGSPFERVRPTKRTRKRVERVSGGAGQETLVVEGNVQDFLADLARQRGMVLSSTAAGKLLIWRSVDVGRHVVTLEEGKQPLLAVTPTYKPREFYSEITGVTAARKGRRGSQYTGQNFLLQGVKRSKSFTLDDTEAADAPTAVQAKMGRMFANMMTVVVTVPTWRDPAGKLWSPNTTVVLKAPSAMVYTETEFLVREAVLNQTAGEETAQMSLVLPGAFSGEVPSRFPWDGA